MQNKIMVNEIPKTFPKFSLRAISLIKRGIQMKLARNAANIIAVSKYAILTLNNLIKLTIEMASIM